MLTDTPQGSDFALQDRSYSLVDAFNQAGGTGAVLSDDDIQTAPEVVPMEPSTANATAPKTRTTTRKSTALVPVQDAGNQWGVPTAAPTCAPQSTGGLKATIQNHPWAWLFLLVGTVLVVYGASEE